MNLNFSPEEKSLAKEASMKNELKVNSNSFLDYDIILL